jgi:hypothetical protein
MVLLSIQVELGPNIKPSTSVVFPKFPSGGLRWERWQTVTLSTTRVLSFNPGIFRIDGTTSHHPTRGCARQIRKPVDGIPTLALSHTPISASGTPCTAHRSHPCIGMLISYTVPTSSKPTLRSPPFKFFSTANWTDTYHG